ncbi:type VI secretion system-associated protein VasI [Celerinatantimonas diazotrophica]|uniref:Type VI secretion system protein VasI n=1 Tax=Celerinatantimonas diazotrophica TaxID=412034 RepID=A0A4R1K4E5_9GAMM|nr:type VI secretion system-associated protein VasI [Celerinatantimonas diazotrophica]TCK59005.1 type VI secretion system protein VasI [Celerinatantimonas diazotrophica]CAG9297640.1 hypothetical protein CEDIAZO_02828 [Celerinatantimonas diazotrophica]
MTGKMVWVAVLLVISSAATVAKPVSQLEKAQQCRQVQNRLQRLQCFDEVFATPVVTPKISAQRQKHAPIVWQRAVEYEKHHNQAGFHLGMENSAKPSEGIWLSATANHWPHPQQPISKAMQKPILMLSCDNKISRVRLLLPKPLNIGRVAITVIGHRENTQSWLVDESGLILESGRGLPAIHLMRALMANQPILLRSNVASVNGLEFSSKGLKSSIKALQKACEWN